MDNNYSQSKGSPALGAVKKYWWALALGIIGLWMWSSYNGIVKAEEGVESQWGNVENVYQRRADLIPNIVKTVKGYAAHEKEVFTSITEARAKTTSINISSADLTPEKIAAFQKAQTGMTSALSRLLAVSERYPDLKANQNFLQLQSQLEGSENRIAVERRKFNETAKKLNTRIKTFPTNVFNKLFGFEEKGYFKAQEGSDVVPEIDFEN